MSVPNPSIREFMIIDGHATIHRAYHAPMHNLSCRCVECGGTGKFQHPQMSSPVKCANCDGGGQEPTKATWSWTTTILKMLGRHQPKFLAMAMDGPRDALHRRKLYPQYKANRGPGSAWDFTVQLRRITQIAKALGICVIQVPGYEADDIIATLVDTAQALPDVYCTMVSRDKDLMQLIGMNCRMYDAMAEEYLDGRHVFQKFGVQCYQMVDYQSLVGDAGDNVPGVKGIGPKAAVALLQAYPTMDAMLKAEVGSGHPLARPLKLLKAQREQHLLSRSLVTLRRDVPLPDHLDADQLRWRGPDLKSAQRLFRMLKFNLRV